jgi:glycosyltransferase involved in cell wall biosynthesis
MKIVHVFRAPVGGLFRHVMDLVKEQAARGHEVGIFCDATFAGDRNETLLEALKADLALGVERAPMRRNPHWTDVGAFRAMGAFARATHADVLHGHGSKGALYARLGASLRKHGPVRAYTPHGGSLNYKPGSLIHRAYMLIERMLERGTDVFLFESQFIADRYHEFVGETDALQRIVLNGLFPDEIKPVAARPDAKDFLYIGEFRFAKGIDTLLAAMAALKQARGKPATLMLVGQGPDEPALRKQTEALGLGACVSFHKPMAAREAFSMARSMIVPSRFESMPYVVIEAAGASMPLISTDVGGIPEIFGPEGDRLIPCDDVPALSGAMARMLDLPEADRLADAGRLAQHIARDFCVLKMATTVLEAYQAAALRRGAPAGAGGVAARAPAE